MENCTCAGPVWLDNLYIRSIGSLEAPHMMSDPHMGGNPDTDGVRRAALWANRGLYITNVTMHGSAESSSGAMWVEASTLVAGLYSTSHMYARINCPGDSSLAQCAVCKVLCACR